MTVKTGKFYSYSSAESTQIWLQIALVTSANEKVNCHLWINLILKIYTYTVNLQLRRHYIWYHLLCSIGLFNLVLLYV
jgi:hypothetical protein